jgi:hypothetical protein
VPSDDHAYQKAANREIPGGDRTWRVILSVGIGPLYLTADRNLTTNELKAQMESCRLRCALLAQELDAKTAVKQKEKAGLQLYRALIEADAVQAKLNFRQRGVRLINPFRVSF